MLLTKAAVIGYAITCGHMRPDVAEMMSVTAWKESKFNASAVSAPNHDGLRDFGLYQIHASNLAALGLTERTALDPCEASRAAATWFKLLSVYNTGNEHSGILNGYAGDTYAKRHDQDTSPEPRAPPAWSTNSALAEPITIARGARQLMVFDGWER